jgi:signal transduction histidine kinase
MKPFSSLTNRIFVATAFVTVVTIGAAVYLVNVVVTPQAEQELRNGLTEAGGLIEEHRRVRVEHFTREASLIADLPRMKATVELDDPATMKSVAEDYQRALSADLLLVTNRQGRMLARVTTAVAAGGNYEVLPGVAVALGGQQSSSFWPHPGGMLQVVSVPIWIDPTRPDILGSLNVGFSLDNQAAARFRDLTNSDVAFGVDGQIVVSTLPEEFWPKLTPLLSTTGISQRVPIGGDEYIAMTIGLAGSQAEAAVTAASTRDTRAATAIVLRSRTEHLGLLSTLHRALIGTGLFALAAATLLSYAIARTITRPLGAITATMREMAATGDLTRRIDLPATSRWEDEDARLLATTFNTMTESIVRFQREAAQRERLSSLGRLSTVVAHEIRNPLMIIKAAVRTLRREEIAPNVQAAVTDIDEEVARLNRIVSEVLDFARPIKFDLAPADLNALCEDAARASTPEGTPGVQLDLDRALGPVVTDAERLRLVLVNVLTNAQLATAAVDQPAEPVRLKTIGGHRHVTIHVRDRGAGIPADQLARIFEPFFTTRRTGTGLGLAISRNIIEGLGGSIQVASRTGEGTDVRIELPLASQ